MAGREDLSSVVRHDDHVATHDGEDLINLSLERGDDLGTSLDTECRLQPQRLQCGSERGGLGDNSREGQKSSAVIVPFRDERLLVPTQLKGEGTLRVPVDLDVERREGRKDHPRGEQAAEEKELGP